MPKSLDERLKSLMEGALLTESTDGVEVDAEMMSEATMAAFICEAENYAYELAKTFIMENAHTLVRDRLLTEDAVGQSFVVLSRDSQRKKAESLLRMQMARKAGDARYFKIAALRKTLRRLTEEIHNDSRYSEARTLVMRKQFQITPNAEALSARRVASQMKLR